MELSVDNLTGSLSRSLCLNSPLTLESKDADGFRGSESQ